MSTQIALAKMNSKAQPFKNIIENQNNLSTNKYFTNYAMKVFIYFQKTNTDSVPWKKTFKV